MRPVGRVGVKTQTRGTPIQCQLTL